MLKKDMSVSLDEFLKYLLKKWKLIVGCVLFGAIIALVTAETMDNSIVVPQSEKYVELKEQEAGFLEYINNSVVMQLNPMNVFERTIFIDHITDRNALKDYIDSGRIWEKTEQEISVNYLIEITSWEDRETSNSAELKVRYSDETTCEELAEYLEKEIRLFDNDTDVTVGVQRTVIDKSLSEKQLWYFNRLQDIQGQLEYAAQGCTIKVSGTVAAAFGILIGGMCAVVVSFFLFLVKKEV